MFFCENLRNLGGLSFTNFSNWQGFEFCRLKISGKEIWAKPCLAARAGASYFSRKIQHMEHLPAPTEEKPRCANCDAKLKGDYCHKCGEKHLDRQDFALSKFLADSLKSLTHLDSKLLRSLAWLVLRPGFLSAEYLRGKRKPYLKPLALFLIINALYFVTISFNTLRTYESPLKVQRINPYSPVVERMLAARFEGASEAERAAFEAAFDARNHTLSKSLLLLFAPMLAAALALICWRRRMYFGEHLVTALHFAALLLLLNMALGIFFYGSLTMTFFGWKPHLHIVIETIEPLLWVWALAFFSLKTAYAEPPLSALFYSLTWALCYLPLLLAYRFGVFLLTFYSI
jgi:hypothetical protein